MQLLNIAYTLAGFHQNGTQTVPVMLLTKPIQWRVNDVDISEFNSDGETGRL